VPPELELSSNLVEAAAQDLHDRRRAWIGRLPDLVAGLAARWELTLGAPFEPGGRGSWTAPVRDAGGQDLVLKVGWAHEESDHEADGLREWAGRGTVRLHAAHREGETSALLVERVRPGTELGRSLPEQLQDEVVADLLRRLWLAPRPWHPFRSLQQMCDQWAEQYEAAPNATLDAGVAREGVAMFRSLAAAADGDVLLLTDLHAGNILKAHREPWLVIDPKPYVGDPTFDPLQHMLNCPGRLRIDPHALADRMADLCGLDRQRLRLWLFARCVIESSRWPDMAEVARRLAPH